MEWFKEKTSIAGTQISNWMIVLGAIVLILLIYNATELEVHDMDPKVLVAIIAGVVTAIGWIVTHFSLKWREDATRRLQLIRDHAAEQIKEFYAPLSALTEQLDAAATICEGVKVLKPEHATKIAELIYADSFEPTHEEIMNILKTKLHLAEPDHINKKSFIDYLHHYRAGHIKAMLDRNGLSADVKDPGFPSDFPDDIRKGLNAAYARYDASIKELQHGQWPIVGKLRPVIGWPRKSKPVKKKTNPVESPLV
jgi:hypothetical protein